MSKKSFVPNLFAIVDTIEKNQLHVASAWVKNSSVKAVFEERKISPAKFRDSYGVPIIGYFIGVVRVEQKLGDCPIMSKLVDYLITKGITPREVFDICIGFRRSLIAFLLTQEEVLAKPAIFMEEVATVFDANLSGVLEKFTALYAESQKKLELAKAQKNKLTQSLNIINSMDTKMAIVKDGRIIVANKPFLTMLGVSDLKVLYEKFKKGFEFLSDITLYEKEFKENLITWFEKVYKDNKPFKSSIYNENLKKKFEYSVRISKIADDSGQFIMTFTNITQYVQELEFLKDELRYDEVTGFRNSITFIKLVQDMILRAKEENFRIFLSVIEIKEYERLKTESKKGIDLILAEVAEDMRYLVDKDLYYGRLDDNRFGILMLYPSEQSSYDWSVKLYHRLNEKEEKKSVSVTEVDLSESVNQLLLRIYTLVEKKENISNSVVETDFTDIIKYSELPAQEEFLNRISRLKELKVSLFYKELQLQSDNKIVATTAESMTIVLTQKQMFAAKKDSEVYFQLPNVGYIKAQIKSVDKHKKSVVIDRFRSDKETPLARKIFRVAAGDDVKAFITNYDIDYEVKVININTEFITLVIDRKRNFEINDLISIDMTLPMDGKKHHFASDAIITKIEKILVGYEMVLVCHYSKQDEELIQSYIAKRQHGIIKEIS